MRSQFPFANFMINDERFHNVVDQVRKTVDPGGAVLDFGGGTCQLSAILAQLGYSCTTYDDLNDVWHLEGDNRQKILDFADRMGINFCMAGEGPLPFADETFDLFMINDVIEHLHDSPRTLFNDVLKSVKPGGHLLVTVPNAVNIKKRVKVLTGRTNMAPYDQYYWYPDPWRGHTREYTKHDLQSLCNNLGLELIELRSCHNMIDRIPGSLQSSYRLATRLFPGWRDTWLLLAKKPSAWQPKYELDDADFKTLMNQKQDH